MGYYLEDLYKPNPNNPVKQALSTRHNFRVIIEKLNDTMSVVNNLVIRNNIVYTYIESVDSTHPFELDFHIPTATSVIKKISLTLKGVPFRAYSTAAASGGSSTPTSGAGLVALLGGRGKIVSMGGEQVWAADAGGEWSVLYEVSRDAIEKHVHTVTIVAHGHGITYGIYQSTTPTTVNGYYDDGDGYSGADSYGNAPDTDAPWNIKTEYDITSQFSGTGWKRLKLDTSRLGKFNIILMVEVDLTPTV